jgi:hypothetical protein
VELGCPPPVGRTGAEDLLDALAVGRSGGLDARDGATAPHDQEALAAPFNRVENFRESPGGVGGREPSHRNQIIRSTAQALLVGFWETRPRWLTTRLSRHAADGKDRRPGLLGERRSLPTGPGEDERTGRRVQALAVELEDGAPSVDEVQLLIRVIRLVVLVDDPKRSPTPSSPGRSGPSSTSAPLSGWSGSPPTATTARS